MPEERFTPPDPLSPFPDIKRARIANGDILLIDPGKAIANLVQIRVDAIGVDHGKGPGGGRCRRPDAKTAEC